jgi:hypothetical protein
MKKNDTDKTQIFDHEYSHYFGTVVENPTAAEWAEALCNYTDGEKFEVATRPLYGLTLVHLGDFGIKPGSKHLVHRPTAEEWREAVRNYLHEPRQVMRRWDGELSLFGYGYDAVKPGGTYTAEQAENTIEREAV